MAHQEALTTLTMASSGDLSSKQYFLTAASTASSQGGIPRTAIAAARGAMVLGVIQSNTTQTGASVDVAVYGVSKVAAGDSSAMENGITYGTPLMASSGGRAVPTTLDIGSYVIGRSLGLLSTGAQGVIPMLITHQGMSSS